MRQPIDVERLRQFIRAMARDARDEVRVFLTGGATALLYGWRATTADIDLKIVPDSDPILRSLPELKERLHLNVEIAAPDHFIPPLPGWMDRSPFIERQGQVSFHHYDLYAQALAKLERGHGRDLEDATQMVRRGLIEPNMLLAFFDQIEPQLYRYPAIDPPSFRRRVEGFVRAHSAS